MELEVIPSARHHGLGLLPWSPLGGGMLGGVLAKATEGRRASELTLKRISEKRPQLERYEAFAREPGEQPADLALAW